MKNYLFSLILCVFTFHCCTNSSISAVEEKQKIPATIESSKGTPKQLPDAQTPSSVKIDTSITLDYIMGKFDPKKHPDFIKVPAQYANGRNDRYLHKVTYQSFLDMYNAAKKEGIELRILSATRNFATQKIIWEGKWTGKRLHESKENLAKTTPNPTERALKILKWSSMPSTSRHHWGTDIDLNALNNEFFEKGSGLKLYTWLSANASKYGFCQPYSPKDAQRPHGYNEEKWHWSYLPLAQKLSQQAQLRLTDEQIKGFKGAETAKSIGVVQKYILGINEECL